MVTIYLLGVIDRLTAHETPTAKAGQRENPANNIETADAPRTAATYSRYSNDKDVSSHNVAMWLGHLEHVGVLSLHTNFTYGEDWCTRW